MSATPCPSAEAAAFQAALPDHTTQNPAPRAPSVEVPIRKCLGVSHAPNRPPDARVGLVLQRADGALHVLTMDVATALAVALAIRADVRV